jgi:SAM-dependent methyltransferase
MRLFYNLFPYPNRPLWLFPDRRGASTSHLGFWRALEKKDFEYAEMLWKKTKLRRLQNAKEFSKLNQYLLPQDRIFLAGCGTDEPLLFRMLHPDQEIHGVDLSEKSVQKAEKRLLLFSFFNKQIASTKLVACDFVTSIGYAEKLVFEYVQCFGVLHHQHDPWPFLDKLMRITAPNGFLRIMIYSANGRRLERRVQKWSSKVWKEKASALSIRTQHMRLWLWQIANRWGLWGKNSRDRFRYLGTSQSVVADALLHPSDYPLRADSVMAHLTKNEFELVFCEAKIFEKGWIVGIQNPKETWAEIVDAENKNNLVSNIVFTVKKRQRPHAQP